VACSTIVQDCLTSRRVVSAYAPPEPLEPLHILDLLELSGSQPKAARALAMHQSTVSRSVAMMNDQFRLQAKPGAWLLLGKQPAATAPTRACSCCACPTGPTG
jgi:hypothetical protein